MFKHGLYSWNIVKYGMVINITPHVIIQFCLIQLQILLTLKNLVILQMEGVLLMKYGGLEMTLNVLINKM